MLELENLRLRYGDVRALDDLSVTIPSGQVVGLLGPNGAGKTSAMRAILGIVAVDGGTIRWRGSEIAPVDRRRIGYLPEERGLYPGMRVLDQLVYLGRLHGLSRGDAAAAATEWLDRLGVVERGRDKVSTLSLGNQQRVQLAAALLHRPELLVLDEPFSGLDPIGIDALGELLDETAAGGATVVFSSHQLDLVEDRCTSVAIVDRGRLVASGSVAELTTAGRRLLAVAVDGSPRSGWASELPGVESAEEDGSHARLTLSSGADPQAVVSAALRLGPLVHFSFERRRLSEVFREAVGRSEIHDSGARSAKEASE